MKRYISFSGGVESTTMCLLYGKGATAIFADTGAEHREMYERLDFIEKAMKDYHDGDFELIKVKADVQVKGHKVDTLIDYIKGYRFMPSVYGNRYCTNYFKIQPIDAFLKKQGPCELMIGFNADEEPGKDRTGSFMKCKNVKYTYPLYEDGIDRQECEAILKTYGLHPHFPIYMKRGGCYMCIFKDKPQYKAMYLFDPDTFKKVKDLEEFIQDKRKRFFPIMAHTGVTMQMIQDEVERELALWGKDAVVDMYANIPIHEPCGAFCHR